MKALLISFAFAALLFIVANEADAASVLSVSYASSMNNELIFSSFGVNPSRLFLLVPAKAYSISPLSVNMIL